MACGCKKKSNVVYVWTSGDGLTTMEYKHEVAAKAKVSRKGGSYQEVPRG